MHTQQERRRKEPRQSSTSQPHVVIVGGGFAGLQAAVQLRNAPVQVTVIDRTNHHVFQPLLYQAATATLSPGEISTPIRRVLRKQKNMQVLMAEVTGVDVQDHRVLIGERALPYDYLVLATGARENYFGHEQWRTEAPGLAGFLAWLLWMAVHIYYLIDFENRILVMLRWAWAYLTYRHGVRIITIWREKPYPAIQQEEPERSNGMAASTKSY